MEVLSAALRALPPWVQLAAGGAVFAFAWLLARSYLRRRTRRGQAHAFLCERNRKALCDAVHSFYLSQPSAEFQITVKDLVARDMVAARHAECPGTMPYAIDLSRGPKGRVLSVAVTCRRHGKSQLN